MCLVQVLLLASMLVVSLLLYQGTALHVAASYGHVDSINKLISAGTEVNTANEVSITSADMQKYEYPCSLYLKA